MMLHKVGLLVNIRRAGRRRERVEADMGVRLLTLQKLKLALILLLLPSTEKTMKHTLTSTTRSKLIINHIINNLLYSVIISPSYVNVHYVDLYVEIKERIILNSFVI